MSSAAANTPKGLSMQFQKLLRRNIYTTNAFVAHVNKLLATPSGIDRMLSLLYYLCTLVAPQLKRTLILAPHLRKLISPKAMHATSIRLKSLASRVSDARMFLRLWGLFGIYEWGVKTLTAPPPDPIEKHIVLAQVGVNTVFQILENLAYLNMHGILGLEKAVEGRMWIWSTRMWAAHIMLEFIRLERSRAVRGTIVNGRIMGNGVGDKEAREAWRKSMVGNAVMAPLSWHWSTENGLISDTVIGALGGYNALDSFRDAWRDSAK